MGRHWVLVTVLRVGVCVALTVMAAGARAERLPYDPEFDALFLRVLGDPANVELNTVYAQQALARGEARKALAAYERILLNDPDNQAAKRGLRKVRLMIEPTRTQFRGEVGGFYESNARRQPRGEILEEDFAIHGRLSFRDERLFHGERWRTVGSVLYNQRTETQELNAGIASVDTGPMLEGPADTILRPAAGVSYAWLDGETLFTEVYGSLAFEGLLEGALHSLTLKAAHRSIEGDARAASGWVFDLTGERTAIDVLHDKDALVLMTRLRYSEPSGDDDDGFIFTPVFPGDYWEVRGRAGYYFPLHEAVLLGATFETYYRDYASAISSGSTERHDTFIAPGAQLIFDEACGAQCDIRFDYRFEDNVSNDAARDYENHVAGIYMTNAF